MCELKFILYIMFISLFTENVTNNKDSDAEVVCNPPLGATTVVEANDNPVHGPLSLRYIHIVYTAGSLEPANNAV